MHSRKGEYNISWKGEARINITLVTEIYIRRCHTWKLYGENIDFSSKVYVMLIAQNYKCFCAMKTRTEMKHYSIYDEIDTNFTVDISSCQSA